MRPHDTLSRDYFEKIYDDADDPWSFATSDYEAEKYARSLAALRPSYASAFEIGCSIGVFTQQLAEKCESLLAVDISDRALERARIRCAALHQITFERAAFPHDDPQRTFDLITCCEVAYYWSDADLALARDRIAADLAPGGDLLLVHWLPKVDDYVRDGDAVHEAFLADPRFEPAASHRAQRYRLDVFHRAKDEREPSSHVMPSEGSQSEPQSRHSDR
jgi:SAM-dependent methyltransferase